MGQPHARWPLRTAAMLKDRIQCLLDECRMLLLGAQVLLGFASEAVFQPAFPDLSAAGRAACAVAVLALVIASGVLMWPAAHHRIVNDGRDNEAFHRFATAALNVGLAPFAVGLAAGFLVVADRLAGPRQGVPVAAAAFVVAIGAWYAIPWWTRQRGARTRPGGGARSERMTTQGKAEVPDRIRQVLTEARMVLPGAQALLGFGTIAVLTERFDSLSPTLKAVHVVGLCCIAFCTVLLMMPAAYHRIAECGEQTAHFHAVASRLLLAAMASLAPGLAADVWVVVEVVTADRALAMTSAIAILLGLYGAWFGWSLVARRQRASAPKRAASA